MDIYAVSGILGTVLSIATFFIPDKWKSKRITLFLFVFLVVILSCVIVNQNSKLTRINKISRAANELVSNREMRFTHEGYIQAGLAFLEQNKDLYPDTYKRSVSIYEKYKKKERYDNDVVDLAFEMDGLIKGIALLNINE
jgi:phosphoglycerol transferase MdoB-like AlkP superfamily enzyme